jgi:hypothetical protein
MVTLTIRTLIRNAAAVFEGTYGAVTRRATQARCSRQTLYEHARRVERHFEPAVDETPSTKLTVTATPTDPSALLDEPARRRFAVTAFAMGISTRQIERLFDLLIPGDGPDHATIARWVKHEAEKAQAVLTPLDDAAAAQVTALALDEVFFGGDRPWSPSSPRA